MKKLPSFVKGSKRAASLSLICFGIALIGCGEEEIEIYEAPRPAITSQTPGHSADDGHDHSGHNHAAPTAQAQPAASNATPGKLSFNVPADWKTIEPGSMVLHRFTTASDATLAISAFPGDVGGIVANVNRWRRQLGLAPEDEAQITAALKAVQIGEHPAQQVDLANDTQRMVVTFGMVDGKTCFFKLTGTSEQIDKAMPALDQFTQSVNWQ